MKKISSFTINHDTLEKGLYVSRIDGDVITYDIRAKKPNSGDYLANPAMHTIEHIFATFVRNSVHSDSVIYFGPMGCRTGFYLLMRDNISKEAVITLVKSAFSFIAEFSGEIPGSGKEECGNYLEHNLEEAKREAKIMVQVLADWKVSDLAYKE